MAPQPWEDDMYDAIVIGGGVAGLQAALTLGRMHRTTLLIDSGEHRNGTVPHAHNLVTNDGRDPAEIRRLAHAELAAYATVAVRAGPPLA
jgi:thioredoxin reductase